MDDSSQNDPGAQQKPTTENPIGYQQFLDSTSPADKPPKRRKIIIYIGIGLVVLLSLLSAVVFIQNQAAKKAVACTSEQCFNQRFAKCLPAAYTDSGPDGSVKYTITGNPGIGCTVDVVYLKAKYSADMIGKKMTCDFDSRLEFQKAAQNVFRFPDDYNCTGDLANIFKNLNNLSGGT